MAKSWFMIRIYENDGSVITTRTEQAETPEEACKLAFGVIYNHPSDTAKWKNIGGKHPSRISVKQKNEYHKEEGFQLFTRPESKKPKPAPTNFDPVRIARDLRSHLEDAVGDIASDMLSSGGGFVDDKWSAYIKRAKKAGTQDLHGSLADALFNDADCIRDTIGDLLYEACNGDPELENKVLDVMMENAYQGMKDACLEMKKENLKEIAQRK